MEITDWIQFIGLLIAIIGLSISILYNKKQIKIYNKQLKLNFFADYTKRYQKIILNFPVDINSKDFDFKKIKTEEKNHILKYMRVYFDLCSEEYDLYLAGYIEERIWNNWSEGIEYAFTRNAYLKSWEIIKPDAIYYADFTNWINKLIAKKEN